MSRGEAAATRSMTTPSTSSASQASTVATRGTSSTGTMPTAATTTARRVSAIWPPWFAWSAWSVGIELSVDGGRELLAGIELSVDVGRIGRGCGGQELSCRWMWGWRQRQGGSAGDGDGAEYAVEDGLGGDALELGLGAQLDAVAQGGVRQGLHVIGGDVVPAHQPRPGPGGGQQRGEMGRA